MFPFFMLEPKNEKPMQDNYLETVLLLPPFRNCIIMNCVCCFFMRRGFVFLCVAKMNKMQQNIGFIMSYCLQVKAKQEKEGKWSSFVLLMPLWFFLEQQHSKYLLLIVSAIFDVLIHQGDCRALSAGNLWQMTAFEDGFVSPTKIQLMTL